MANRLLCVCLALSCQFLFLHGLLEDADDEPLQRPKRVRRAVPNSPHQFYELMDDGYFKLFDCPYALGQHMIYEPQRRICTLRAQSEGKSLRKKRQAFSVGMTCFENTDCIGQGMYCDGSRRCACLTTFVDIGGICWQKLNPDQNGCSNSRQCDAVWPASVCTSSGTCKCANNQPAFQTRDGTVCVNYGTCPLGGETAKFQVAGLIRACLEGPIPIGPITFYNSGGDCPATYDCICNVENTKCESLDRSVYTFCCPSRALTCNMQSDSGFASPGGGAITRYYYNQITANCEVFQYYGVGGNANNFQTREHCESYCKLACTRGMPQYTKPLAAGLNAIPTAMTCTGSSGCDTKDFQCTALGTTSTCCPTPSFICSNTRTDNGYGGAPYFLLSQQFPVPATIYDPGLPPSDTSPTFSRFYYNATAKRCILFAYNGQGGNFNNFFTQDQCITYCAQTLCNRPGTPLKDSGGVEILSCAGTTGCPATHECVTTSVCCPRAQSLCTQPRSVGTCSNYVERWWYNAATRNCELFSYSGCLGNDNNFASYLDCSTFCKDIVAEPQCIQGKALKDTTGKFVSCGGTTSTTCPTNYDCFYDGSVYGCCATQSYTCSLSSDQGTSCGPTVTRWYYNSQTRTCATFTYNGCDGNPNNFATQQDCQDFCGVGGCPEGGEPFRDGVGQYRICSAVTTCPYTHYCTSVTLLNNVQQSYCCPTRTYVCSLPREEGQRCQSASMTRYYFNAATRNCESFQYNGCSGNRNNFAVSSQCLNYCNSAGCPPGTIAQFDGPSNLLTQCNIGTPSTCPSGFNCLFSTLLSQSICCGAPATGDCPPGFITYIDPRTVRAMQCELNVGGCPANYFCWYSFSSRAPYCCGRPDAQCPLGGTPYMETASGTTSTAKQCTPGVVGACPTGFACQATSISVFGVPSTTGYCCGNPGFCPNNGQPQMVNNSPIPCARGSPGCSAPYSCQFSTVMNQSYCCTPAQTTATAVCGSQSPYLVNGAPVVCDDGSFSLNCPSPFRCQLYAQTNTFYCCQTGQGPPSAASGCPPGLSPTLVDNTPGQFRYCSPNIPDSCPYQSFCSYDATVFKYLCCGRSFANVLPTTPFPIIPTVLPTPLPTQSPSITVCPGNALAYVNPFTNQALQCLPNLTGCPPNFACTQSPNANVYHCCGSALTTPPSVDQSQGCPTGRPYMYPNTTFPLTCQPGGASCPGGYQCAKSARLPGYQCCSANVVARPTLRPGDDGCTTDAQCKSTGEANARCADGRCLCSANLLVFTGRCVGQCPWPYYNLRGVCVMMGAASERRIFWRSNWSN